MNIKIHTENVELTPAQSKYITEKIEVLKKNSEKISDEVALVSITVEKNKHKDIKKQIVVKVSMSVPHALFRAETASMTVEEGIDLIQEKLEKQIKRYKAKHVDHVKTSIREIAETVADSGLEISESGHDPRIVKRKLFSDLIPMSEIEALDQMLLLGHSFFVFVNEDTDRYNLVYKRLEGDGFGLVELEYGSGVLN